MSSGVVPRVVNKAKRPRRLLVGRFAKVQPLETVGQERFQSSRNVVRKRRGATTINVS